MIHDGVNGYLFPAGSDETFYVNTIKKVFSDKQLYSTMRKKSRAEFEKRLSWSVWIDEVNKLIGTTNASEIVAAEKKKYYK